MLYTNPRHRVSSYTVSSSRDAGGGTELTYTLAQAAIPCSINTASASTVQLYMQSNIRVSVTVGFLASTLTTTLTPGMKLVSDDTSETLRIEGIRQGRAAPNNSIPALVYADCSVII